VLAEVSLGVPFEDALYRVCLVGIGICKYVQMPDRDWKPHRGGLWPFCVWTGPNCVCVYVCAHQALVATPGSSDSRYGARVSMLTPGTVLALCVRGPCTLGSSAPASSDSRL